MSDEMRRVLAGVGLLGVILVPACGWALLGSPNRSQRWTRIVLLALATCYLLGKGCQQLLWGPRIVRFYLADIGFIPCVAIVSGMLVWTFSMWRERLRLGQMAILGWTVAMAVELYALIIQSPGSVVPFAARGDLWDVVIFCLMLPVTLALIIRACDPPVRRTAKAPTTSSLPPTLQRRPKQRHRRKR